MKVVDTAKIAVATVAEVQVSLAAQADADSVNQFIK